MLIVRSRPGALPLGAILLGLAAAGAAAIVLLHVDRLPFFVCMFRAVTGWPCLTCGATRAAALLALGDLRGALAMNPLATLAGVALVPWGLADLVLTTRGRAVAVEATAGAGRMLRIAAVTAVALNWAYLVAAGI